MWIAPGVSPQINDDVLLLPPPPPQLSPLQLDLCLPVTGRLRVIDDYLGDRGQHNNMIPAPCNNWRLSFTDEDLSQLDKASSLSNFLFSFFFFFLVVLVFLVLSFRGQKEGERGC